MLLGVSGQTLAGFSHRLEFYRTDEQGRMFDKYGERIYQEGEVQTEESSKEEEMELGVERLPEDDSDDKDILAGKPQRTVKQREGEQTPETMREEGNRDSGSESGDGGDDEQEECKLPFLFFLVWLFAGFLVPSCPKRALVLGNGCERFCTSRSLLGSYVHQKSI